MIRKEHKGEDSKTGNVINKEEKNRIRHSQQEKKIRFTSSSYNPVSGHLSHNLADKFKHLHFSVLSFVVFFMQTSQTGNPCKHLAT